MNSFGRKLRISIFGESHGQAVGVVLDGVPAGISLTGEDLQIDLDRRRAGAPGTTTRRESDTPQIVSGIFNNHTTGAPLTVLFRNENTSSGDYTNLQDHPRPSHADFVASHKYSGYNDPNGGGHFSGRITLGMVAAGAIAKKIIPNISISARIVEIGGITLSAGDANSSAPALNSTTHAQSRAQNCDEHSAADHHAIKQVVEKAMAERDSVGSIVECRATGIPIGLGEPFFDSVESLLSHLLFSIPAVKGVEFGSGFAAARMRGSDHNDPIIDSDGTTSTNHAGGIVGGITNGNELIFRVAIKPTPSISKTQLTYNFAHGVVEELQIKGRHDGCIALRMPVIVESAAALVLADLTLIMN